MQSNLISTLGSVVIFTMVMLLLYKYGNGKWKVSDSKIESYKEWTDKHGKSLKKAIIILSIMYYIFMIFQFSILNE